MGPSAVSKYPELQYANKIGANVYSVSTAHFDDLITQLAHHSLEVRQVFEWPLKSSLSDIPPTLIVIVAGQA